MVEFILAKFVVWKSTSLCLQRVSFYGMVLLKFLLIGMTEESTFKPTIFST